MFGLETIIRLLVESKLNPKQRKQAKEIEQYVKAARTARWRRSKGDSWPEAVRWSAEFHKMDVGGLAKYLDVVDKVGG